ncbi:MAG: glycoside hydrolase domain-containing protein [Planctomycetota bacterium]
MKMKRFAASLALAVALWNGGAWVQAQAATVIAGYKTPTVTAPYAYQKPVIDGVINDVEWQGAESVNALQTTGKQVSPRQTRFWMMWDEDNLYIAMRSPLREGERIVQNLRDTSHEINVVFDDSYEIFLDVGSQSPDGQPVFFQYLANFAGAHYLVMHEPAVGNSRLGWKANWNVRNRLTPDGRAWEMEAAIPRQGMYRDKPFADGDSLTVLMARDYKKPWEQNSFEGTSTFAVRDTHTKVLLSKSAPAIHLLRVANPQAQTFGLELAAFSNEAVRLAWSFTSAGGMTKSGTFDVPKGKLATAPGTALDFDKVPEQGKPAGSYRICVTSADGKTTYLDWASMRQFGNLKTLALETPDSNDRIGVTLTLNPVNDYVRIIGDFIDYANRGQVERCDVAVLNDAGNKIAQESYKVDETAYVRGLIPLAGLPEGKYSAKLSVIGKNGLVLREMPSEFSKENPARKFKWWNTTAGNIEKVLPPWTPVKVKGQEIEVWGRTMTIGAAGLPAQVVSQGRALFAAPAVLRAELPGGKTVEALGAAAKIASAAGHRVVADSRATLGDIEVASHVTAEFDGMYKVEMTLTPKGKADVKSLKMAVPLDPAVAGYVYGKGEGIREGFYMGYLPQDKTGTIWDCRKTGSQAMTVGSFIPYVWVGNPEAGICWFADSDRGWVPSSTTPAIELLRKDKSVEMVFNLISEAFTMDAPRTIIFAFQASPAKALQGAWRANRWWCGSTFDWGGGGWVYPDGKGSTIWQSRPHTTVVELCRKKADEVHKGGGLVVPYFEYNTMADAGEQAYFGEAWKTSSGPLFYGKSLSDYIIWNLDDWIKSCGIDGWYLDNVRPVCCDNINAGRGYRLPDRRVQPEFNMFGMREFFLRLRAVFHENGKDSVIVNHMTNNQILPWNAAVDVAYDGEHHVIYPEMGKDFMDFWTLERLFTIVPGTWGINVNFMNEYQGAWDPEAKRKAMRAYSGAVLMHDALPTGNSASDGSQRSIMAARDRFGIAGDDVSFIGYWKKDSGLACPTQNVYLAGWAKPGKVLVGVVNWGEKAEADVRLDFKKLGLPATCKASDAEKPETQLAVSADGRLTVPVEHHDFRLIIVEAAEPRQ